MDAALFDGVRAGDIRAFERLYRGYYPRLSRFLNRLLRRPSLVEEVLNDTMLVVWTRPSGFSGHSKLSTWIFAIAYRKALRALERLDEPLSDDHIAEQPSGEPDPEQAVDARLTLSRVIDGIAMLSPAQRAVIELTHEHGMRYDEIAMVLSCPVDTVKTRMFHARRQLRQHLVREPLSRS